MLSRAEDNNETIHRSPSSPQQSISPLQSIPIFNDHSVYFWYLFALSIVINCSFCISLILYLRRNSIFNKDVVISALSMSTTSKPSISILSLKFIKYLWLIFNVLLLLCIIGDFIPLRDLSRQKS
eukprot:437370_1